MKRKRDNERKSVADVTDDDLRFAAKFYLSVPVIQEKLNIKKTWGERLRLKTRLVGLGLFAYSTSTEADGISVEKFRKAYETSSSWPTFQRRLGFVGKRRMHDAFRNRLRRKAEALGLDLDDFDAILSKYSSSAAKSLGERNPTPDEIRKRAAEIRKTWTPEIRRARQVFHPPDRVLIFSTVLFDTTPVLDDEESKSWRS